MNSKQLKSTFNLDGAFCVCAMCLCRVEVNVQTLSHSPGSLQRMDPIDWLHWLSNNPARFVIGGQTPAAAPAPEVGAESQTSGP